MHTMKESELGFSYLNLLNVLQSLKFNEDSIIYTIVNKPSQVVMRENRGGLRNDMRG